MKVPERYSILIANKYFLVLRMSKGTLKINLLRSVQLYTVRLDLFPQYERELK